MTQKTTGLMVQKQGGVHVVEFLDSSILDQANIERIRTELLELVERSGHPKFVISFENVGYISSAVLGVLMNLQKMISKDKGAMRLAHISPKLREIFKLTGLEKVIPIYETTDKALANF